MPHIGSRNTRASLQLLKTTTSIRKANGYNYVMKYWSFGGFFDCTQS